MRNYAKKILKSINNIEFATMEYQHKDFISMFTVICFLGCFVQRKVPPHRMKKQQLLEPVKNQISCSIRTIEKTHYYRIIVDYK